MHPADGLLTAAYLIVLTLTIHHLSLKSQSCCSESEIGGRGFDNQEYRNAQAEKQINPPKRLHAGTPPNRWSRCWPGAVLCLTIYL